MKLSLGQYQIQKLALTPQTKLYLKILQLPLADLKLSLEDTLGQNPALDELEPAEEPISPQDPSLSDEKIDFWESGDAETNFSDEEDDNLSDRQENSRKKAYLDSLITKETTLMDHLVSQFTLLNLTEEEKIWSETLLGNLDENGRLIPSLSELSGEIGVRVVDLENLLTKLQTLEPIGVFARNLQECLLLQLKTRKDERCD